jgi:hypothetical protein
MPKFGTYVPKNSTLNWVSAVFFGAIAESARLARAPSLKGDRPLTCSFADADTLTRLADDIRKAESKRFNSSIVNGGVKTGHGAEQKSATAAPA